MSKSPLAANAGLAAGALLASSATLVCCVLPAVLVALGAGVLLCQRLRRLSTVLYLIAISCFAVGALFAFVLPSI